MNLAVQYIVGCHASDLVVVYSQGCMGPGDSSRYMYMYMYMYTLAFPIKTDNVTPHSRWAMSRVIKACTQTIYMICTHSRVKWAGEIYYRENSYTECWLGTFPCCVAECAWRNSLICLHSNGNWHTQRDREIEGGGFCMALAWQLTDRSFGFVVLWRTSYQCFCVRVYARAFDVYYMYMYVCKQN